MEFIKRNIKYGLIPVLAVWLFTTYPIFALYAHNVDQLLLKQLFLPVIFSLAMSTILFGFLAIILKDKLKASLATVVLLIIFWNYGLLYIGFSNIAAVQHWHLIPLSLVIYLHLVYFIKRNKQQKALVNLNTILFWPILFLISINGIIIISAEFKKVNTSIKENKTSHQAPEVIAGKYHPDIYLIILDECASLQTIKEEWGYDNSAFADFLRDKGFFVAENSESRYNQTAWCITSLLNLDYVTGPVDKSTVMNFNTGPEVISGNGKDKFSNNLDFNEVMQKLNNNYLTNYLKEQGYKLIVLEGISHIQSSFKIKNIDISFSYQDLKKADRSRYLLDAFYLELINKTMIKPFDMFFQINQTFNINYTGAQYIISYLKTKVYQIESPKFIYAHIMSPHGPYVFDRKGDYVGPITADGQRVGGVIPAKNTVNEAYLEQYIHICNEIKSIVNNHIQQRSPADPIMIIQSDHGPRPYDVYLKNRMNSFKVFNAVYFPDGDYRNLYDSIAPVNTMRVLLNKYFGKNYLMLEDK
jgi:hypothetical protein